MGIRFEYQKAFGEMKTTDQVQSFWNSYENTVIVLATQICGQ